jgi:hypothetical protein
MRSNESSYKAKNRHAKHAGEHERSRSQQVGLVIERLEALQLRHNAEPESSIIPDHRL